MATDRLTPCLYYICAGMCKKGRNVNTDELVHTARSSSACFPEFQCTLSAA